MYKDLDIRFENEKLSILVETKQNLNGTDLKNGLIIHSSFKITL